MGVAFKLRRGKLRKKQDWTTFAPSTTVDQSHPLPPLRTLTAHIEKTHKTKWGGITINYPYKSWPGTPGGFDSATDYLGKCVSSRGIETRYKIIADEREKWA